MIQKSACVIQSWRVCRGKRVTSREKNRVLKSEILNLFQKNRVNSLSLLFCHSKSNSVSIPVYFVALNCIPSPFICLCLFVRLFASNSWKLELFFYFPRRFEFSEVDSTFRNMYNDILFQISLFPLVIIIRYKIHYFTLGAGVFFFPNPWRSTVCPRYFENGAPESFPVVDVCLSRREEK